MWAECVVTVTTEKPFSPSSQSASLAPHARREPLGEKRSANLKPRRLVRRGAEAIVLLAIGALLANAFFIDGWFVPSVVSSGSMAPALFGPHHEARCEACGMPLACDAEDLTVDSLVCLNCGWPNNPLEPSTIAGDRLLIDRATLGIRPPRRWEVVVFHCPSHAQSYCVKRIAGLPGEKVEVRNGDVYINGQIARKILAEQRKMALLVHDSAYRDPRLPTRWKANDDNTNWTANADGGWSRTGSDDRSPHPIDWLTYRHCRRVAGSPDSIEETPIRDDDPYNPETSRLLNDVTDVMLVARLQLSGSGPLFLRANDGREVFQVEIDSESGRARLERGSREVQSIQFTTPLLNRPIELVLSTFDRRLLLAINGHTESIYDYESANTPRRPVSRPFAIGVIGLHIAVRRLQLFRDVYYTPPTHAVKSLARQLGPNEYFVLGDNSPISVDSRSWMGGETVPARLLIGRLLKPATAAR